jgi:hypothetical protein
LNFNVAGNETKVEALMAEVERLRKLVEEQRKKIAGRSSAGSPTTANAIYKKLVRKYHPDRNPDGAEIMADINELHQAMR